VKPYYADDSVTLHHGDSLDVLRALADSSVDSIVTDPPYGLADHHPKVIIAALTAWLTGDREHVPDGKGFMGRDWDRFVPPPALWDECLRVLKPGGHLLAFAAPRTADLMTTSIRLAGFEIRDGIDWLYASGFPKGQDIGKAIDRMRSEDRPAILRVTAWLGAARAASGVTHEQMDDLFGFTRMASHWTTQGRAACVPTVEQWEQLRGLIGFGHEMDEEVCRLNSRKGEIGADFAAREVVGTRHAGLGQGNNSVFLRGAAGVDERGHVAVTVAASNEAKRWEGWNTSLKPAREPIVVARKSTGFNSTVANVLEHGTGALNIAACRVDNQTGTDAVGRWPANVVLSHASTCGDTCSPGCPVAELDGQSGTLTSGANPSRRGSDKFRHAYGDFKGQAECTPARGADRGGASRFFPVFRYEAKASAAERPQSADGVSHPTVKPLELMRWLVRLVTPVGGTVLEPFAGSGTTAEACVIEGLRCVAIERESSYLPLITSRLTKPLQPTLDLFAAEVVA
jgi:DNA modification methylase